jgi:hypothetical protein
MNLSDIVKGAVDTASGREPEPEPVEDGFVPSENPDPIEGEGDNDGEVDHLVDASSELPIEGEETENEPVQEEAAPVVETPAPVAETEDAFAVEHGIKSKDKSGRENRIPYSNVKKINENAVKKARTQWEAETKPLVAERDARIKEYETRLTKVGNTEKVMFEDAPTFLGMLIEAIPAYKQLLGPHVNLDAQGRVTGLKAAGPQVDPNDPEPQPDVDMGNGQIGYSPEQHRKLRLWDQRQAEEKAYTRAKTDISNEFKPIRDVFEMGQRQREAAQQREAQVNEAMQWPGFQQNFDAILKVMNEDSTAKQAGTYADYKFPTMRDAYNHVMYQKANGVTETATQMEARIRKEVTESLRRAPRATSAGASTGIAPVETPNPAEAEGGTAAVIAASLKGRR